MDVSWNPCDDIQAIQRCYRFGQKHSVYTYRLLAAGSCEVRVFERQLARDSLACRIVDNQVSASIHEGSTSSKTSTSNSTLHVWSPECENANEASEIRGSDEALDLAFNSLGSRWIKDIKQYSVILRETAGEDPLPLSSDPVEAVGLRKIRAIAEFNHEIRMRESVDKIKCGNLKGGDQSPKASAAPVVDRSYSMGQTPSSKSDRARVPERKKKKARVGPRSSSSCSC
uniref:Helicase C-terminal domain-containing protein n=1 Tax=Amorphochlora amoebiformis TaxID=1561963 RepID=A0A7S0CR97_9EUKA|mmetsp:Transcript_1119/g.1559  ORF Transcript_1119/g.1559 Transcript_1119/m.1559 type:complete len:228 (+) Transcript_1119:269-952(+)